MNNSKKISVIIPARNEAGQIRATLRNLSNAPNSEIIVVDGGSTDATRSLALAAGATVLGLPTALRPHRISAPLPPPGKFYFFSMPIPRPRPITLSLFVQALQLPDVAPVLSA